MLVILRATAGPAVEGWVVVAVVMEVVVAATTVAAVDHRLVVDARLLAIPHLEVAAAGPHTAEAPVAGAALDR